MWLLGGWTKWTDAPEELIYLFEALTGKMVHVISGLPEAPTASLSPRMADIWQLGLARDGLRIFDRDQQWAEVFRDTDYGDRYRATFAPDGRLATTSLDGMIRLYNRGFMLVVPPKKGSGGNTPWGIAFSPDGARLAVGYNDVSRR